jgi:Ca-activated chloride channel homolog
MLIAAAFSAAGGLPLRAESAASMNRRANQLFEQKKYAEAEQQYIHAQVDLPGRPELLYNLGNSLIKQRKYPQALQSLRQAIDKTADRPLRQKGWFNAGNALFEMGDYRNSIQAYTESLKIDPADQDAKHNLELAWRKLQDQQQRLAGTSGNKENDQNSGGSKGQSQSGGENQGKTGPAQNGSRELQQQGQQQETPTPDMRAADADRQEGGFTKERALQILDALQNQELIQQRRLLDGQARRKTTGKDW